jgi:hypothetical protein
MATIRERLEEVFRAPPDSPDRAELAARAAEVLAAYLRADQQARRLLDPHSSEEDPQSTGRFSGLSLDDAAAIVLEEAGTPLHVRELGSRIKAGGWTHKRSKNPASDQINYQLAARLPRSGRFVRVAPNTFGLAEWGVKGGRRRKPRLGVFRGPGTDVAGRIGEHPEEALESGQ